MQCVFHREEYITNFCRSEKCLLPLCPVCVKLHSEEHARGDRFGIFQLIDVCIDQAYSQLSQHCEKLNMCKQKIGSVNDLRKNMESRVVEQIQNAKRILFQEIEREFAKFEDELNFIMDEKEKEIMGLIIRIQELIDPACTDIEATMFRLRQPDTCLQSLIHYYYYRTERIQDWDHTLLSANEHIKQACESRTLKSNLSPEALTGIKPLIDCYINVSSQSLPIPTYELPIVTSSSKARYVGVQKCCSGRVLGQYSRRVC